MAYFPNGESARDYEERYCDRCVHQKPDDGGCAVMLLHLLRNYEECDKPDSPLHVLIPRNGLDNEQCRMFYPSSEN